MIRTQIQLPPEQLKALKQLALARNQSLADLVRQSVERFLAEEAENGKAQRIQRAIDAIGMFTSDATDVSTNHDRYLADTFLE